MKILKAETTAQKPTGEATISPFRAAVMQANRNMESLYATHDSIIDSDDMDSEEENIFRPESPAAATVPTPASPAVPTSTAGVGLSGAEKIAADQDLGPARTQNTLARKAVLVGRGWRAEPFAGETAM